MQEDGFKWNQSFMDKAYRRTDKISIKSNQTNSTLLLIIQFTGDEIYQYLLCYFKLKGCSKTTVTHIKPMP
jgi:hypothetical protein